MDEAFAPDGESRSSIIRKLILLTGPSFFVLLLVWFYLAPYITLYQLRAAAQNGDAEELAELVDFPALRESLKEEMRTVFVKELGSKAEGNPFAALGMMMATAMVDPMVDTFVSPSGLAALSSGKHPQTNIPSAAPANIDQRPRETKIPDPDMQMGYTGLSKFRIRFPDRETGKDTIVLVMRREGFSWKLTAIHLPGLLNRETERQ